MPDNTPKEQSNNTVPSATPAVDVAKQAAQATADQAKQTAQAAADQAKQALSGGLQKGADQLKNLDVKSLLKPKDNQPKVSNDEKLWAVVSYIPLVAFLALLMKPDSNYLKLHGRQGIVLSIIFFLSLFLISWIPFIGDFLFNLIWLILTVTGVFYAYNALVGNWSKIPVVGDLAEQIPVELFAKIVSQTPAESTPPTQSNDSQPAPTSAPTQGQNQPPV